MNPSEVLALNIEDVKRVVAAHHVTNARIFGSAAHGEDGETSDIDILVDPTPDTTLFDIGAVRLELSKLLGVSVDVLTPNALHDNFRDQVLAEARPL